MITLGVIGAGIMGERMLRAALEQASELVRVTGIWDPSAEALARIGGLAPHAGSAASLIAGADCGFGGRSHPQIAWAKLKALTEGAALASKALGY